MIKSIIYAGLLGCVLVACTQDPPKSAYDERGNPESLLDVSSEVVNLKVDSADSIKELTNWIDKDQPTRAELSCQQGTALCTRAHNVLHQFSVPVKYTSSSEGGVALIYERVLARDCKSHYVDNPTNERNLNHKDFGCSLAVNKVQMITDKHELTNPALMDYPDATKAVQAMGSYSTPTTYTPPAADATFSPLATSGSVGGGGGGSSGGR